MDGKQFLVVAFTYEDCEANLDFLSLIERPELSASVNVLALFSGRSKEFNEVRGRLESRYPHVRFRTLRDRQAKDLALLGHRSTPFWVLFDRTGTLTGSGAAPENPLDYSRFASVLVSEFAADRSRR